jgi:putative FmdB family regulatory protein
VRKATRTNTRLIAHFRFRIPMPTYEYICNDCSHEMEAFQSMSAAPLTVCPACGQPSLRRKIGRGAGIIFKGGGFYETDFKDRKGKAGGETSAGGDSPSAKPATGEASAAKNGGDSAPASAPAAKPAVASPAPTAANPA